MPIVMDADRIGRTLTRIAHEIVERNKGVEDLALVGVRTRGVHIARRLARALREITGHDIPTGALDITLYRDDVFHGLPKPEIGPTDLPGSVEGRRVVLVDDVLYTGRTVRAAMDVLADYVGIKVETTGRESVRVMLSELGEPDRVVLRERVAT